jgi:AcrR family transcriptional regulator
MVDNYCESSRDGRYTRHSDRRRELLDAAIDYIFREGLAGLSIRPMAEALGISHRTLLHHFGSKEELVARVLAEVRTRQLDDLRRRATAGGQGLLGRLDAAWEELSAPQRLPFWRAFFEIYGIAARNPQQYAEFLEGIVKAWLPNLVHSAQDEGLPKNKAEVLATLCQANARGLILDLLTTGDHKRVQKAYGMFREAVRQQLDSAASRRQAGRSRQVSRPG